MQQFIARHRSAIRGTLSGFDRLRFRGTLRLLASVSGMAYFLHQIKVQLKDFGTYVNAATAQMRAGVVQAAQRAGLEIQHLQSPAQSKEELVQRMLQERPVTRGLICILSCVEPCRSYDVYRDRKRRMIELASRRRQCLHYYHYLIDPMFGLLHVRTQTWFPFTVHLCLNGREWLARKLDAAQIGYQRRDNAFLDIEDFPRAQRLMDGQLRTSWRKHLDRLARAANPALRQILGALPHPIPYYWSLDQSEWATDVVFHSAADLQRIYSRLIAYGMQNFCSDDVMRFLGRKTPVTPGRYGHFAGEVVSDCRTRQEGIRLKHRINQNSVKMYDKFGCILRVETTINNPRDMKVYRPKEGDPQGPKKWRRLRKGVADTHRRAQLSQRANERYLDALAKADVDTPLGELFESLCQPVTWKGKRVRAMNPFSQQDAQLLESIAGAEFLIHGFRNRDLRPQLYETQDVSDQVRRRQSAAVSRKLRLLRAHHLIKKVPHTHRYQLTERGRLLVTAILTTKKATLQQLNPAA
jgi:hypothetical protein